MIKPIRRKRASLTQALSEKIQVAIDKTAQKYQLDAILQQQNTAGVSTVVYAPDESNLTGEIMRELAITPPSDLPAFQANFIQPSEVSVGYSNIELVLIYLPEIPQNGARATRAS